MTKQLQSNTLSFIAQGGNVYKTTPPPVAGTTLLSLDPANAGNSAYTYWDYDANYLGGLRLGEANLQDSPNATLGLVNGGNTLLVASAYGTGERSANLYGFDISSPTFSQSSALTDLSTLTRTINAFDAVAGAPVQATSWALGARISGLCEYNGRVMGNVYGFYDGGNEVDQSTFVLDDATNPGTTNERGFFAATNISRMAGWISEIPQERKAALGGTHIMGMSSGNQRSIAFRFSLGPSLYVYDADAANSIVGSNPPTNGAAITANAVMDFPLGENSGLTPESLLSSANQPWTHESEAYYGFIVPGTDTYMVVGYSAGHAGGLSYGVSPWNGNQGFYPLQEDDIDNHYWLFRVSDILAATNAGEEVTVYEHGRLTARFEGPKTYNAIRRCRGAVFDSVNNRLILALAQADTSQGTFSPLPLLVCYDMNGVVS